MLYMKLAKPDDADVLGDLYFRCFNETNRLLLEEKRMKGKTLEECTEAFRKNKCHHVVIGYFNDKPIGFCHFGESRDKDVLRDSAEIYEIYIEERYRLNGFGRRLLHQAVRELREDDYRLLFMWCQQDDYNVRSFAEAVGLIFDGTNREFADGYPINKVRYFENI